MANGKWQNSERKSALMTQVKFERQDTRERAFQFALRVVHLCDFLDAKPGSGRTLARQLLKAATSIGANLEEAQAGHSRADFIAKTEIALKEAREARYWLRLVAAAELVPLKRIGDLQTEVEELSRIVAAIVLSAKHNRT
jgi:four helix bundle protein